MDEPSEAMREALADRYVLQREQGRGGMATVYLARDLRHDRPVALKVLRPELGAALGPERFQREIRLAARLQHPHILTVLDSGEAAGRLWFTMPFVEGESLRDRLRRERQLPVDDALRVAREAAQALQYAHEHGIIHRDVKPENLLLTRDGNTLVADFGIARALHADDERLTETGLAVGTPAYMSPEQATGDKAVDARTDVYSLATVLYEMIVGQPPYTGATTQAMIARRLAEPPPSVRPVRPTATAQLDQAIQKALSPVPADRFGTMAQFAAALQATTAAPVEDKASPRRQWLPAAALLAVLAGVGAVWAVWPHSAGRARSIVVLPFVNMSPDADNAYFSDGLTEEIITRLSAVPELKVISRTSAMHYKGSRAPLRQIADELNVVHVLEGSVRQSEGHMRIAAQLIDARGDEHLWAANYDYDARNMFRVQQEIAREVVRALEAELGERGSTLLARQGTRDSVAYDLYRRGRFLWTTRTKEGHEKAIEYFERAIQRDSGYSDAYAGLADAYLTAYQLGISSLPEAEAYSRVKWAAERALALDEESADAHTSFAVSLWWQRNWPGAERELRRALELNPGHASARGWYALLLGGMGRLEEAVRESRLAAELDPFAVIVSITYAWTCYLARDYDCAIEQYRRTLEINSSWAPAYTYLGWSYAKKGMHQEAIRAVSKAGEIAPESPWNLAELAYVHALAGGKEEAVRLLKRAMAKAKTTYQPEFTIARVYAALGKSDSAFVWLERSDWQWPHRAVRADPALDPLRDDPRFAELSARIDREMGLQ